jgi:16S rRNA (cytosine967-C5)-methyltransferase
VTGNCKTVQKATLRAVATLTTLKLHYPIEESLAPQNPEESPQNGDDGRGHLRESARRVVCRHLAEQCRRFPNLSLETFKTEGLDGRDAALAHLLYDVTVRRWVTLEYLLNLRLERPLRTADPRLAAVLLTGAAQLFFFDRIPTHAAIDEAVEFTKHWVQPRAAGMVNAVLRRVAEMRELGTDGDVVRVDGWRASRNEVPLASGKSLKLVADLLPEDPIERMAVACGLTPWLLRRVAQLHGNMEKTRLFAFHTLTKPPVVLNVKHATSEVVAPEGCMLTPHSQPGHMVFDGPHELLGQWLHQRKDIWAQDSAASKAIELCSNLKPKLIADLCAGQGTKSRQLVAAFPTARVIVSDASPEAMGKLRKLFEGSDRVKVVDRRNLLPTHAGSVDLAVLDVPCSNSAVLARRAEAALRCDGEQLERLATAQRQIIADTIPLLRPSGHVLYSTCSIDREENGRAVDWAIQWHKARPLDSHTVWPAGLPGQPGDVYMDGGFACLMQWSQR